FESNPQILDLITDICATAPGLAAQLARNTAVLDAVVSGRFFDALPGQAAYESALSAQLDQAGDYEDVLACARRWHREEHFRISVLILRGLADLDEAEAAYSALAEAVLSSLLPHVCADAARRYGRFARQEIAVLGMGKLGSRQMTATSDLDLIVIYRTEGDAADGRQGLAAPQYFARLTQALITALSTPMGDGRLYEVDMRLRPSGRGGPVAVSLAGFKSYQERDAWVWEHMALTRARVVAGDATLRQDVAAVRAEVLAQQRERPAVFSAVRDMRDRIARARGRVASPWEVKDRPGGVLDIELLAQGLALLRGGSTDENPRAQLRAAMTAGFLQPETQQSLVATLRLLCAVQQVARVLVDGPFEPDTLGNSVQTRIADFVGQEVTADRLAELQEDAQAQIGRILG
ncbi:MAG: glutamine-synthetase adenylyltransferase, partial [Pseudomonadota bacterium]